MDTITLKNILMVIQRTINSVDNRLLNHGEQVGYICMRMGLEMGYTHEQLLPMCALAMIHDIGAYKVEERSRMIEFEVERPHEHAVYGSLFVRHFGPFQNAENIILYHHWKYENRYKVVEDRLIPSEAFLIHLADRVSVLYAHTGVQLAKALQSQIPPMAGKTFDPEHVTLLMDMVKKSDMIDKLLDGSYLADFYDFLDQEQLTSDEAILYLSILVYAIEFRSRQTVTHSISVAIAATQIAGFMGLSEHELDTIRHAALLHDVGKITTPIEILTKPGALTDSEMATMRMHVVATAEILEGTGLDFISRIASSHHEKLNGRGYPLGINEENLCVESRILAVADILTALVEPRYYKPALSKEAVMGIMGELASVDEIDTNVLAVVLANYDRITVRMGRQQKQILAQYDEMAKEYDQLLYEVHYVLDTSVGAEMITQKAA